jgi:hypothetical protein
MLNMVAEKMYVYESKKGSKQSCSYENLSFTKKLYFNPGLPLDQVSMSSTLYARVFHTNVVSAAFYTYM